MDDSRTVTEAGMRRSASGNPLTQENQEKHPVAVVIKMGEETMKLRLVKATAEEILINIRTLPDKALRIEVKLMVVDYLINRQKDNDFPTEANLLIVVVPAA